MGTLKQQSNSGATGFGNLNMGEFNALSNAATRLDMASSDADVAQVLNEIRPYLQKITEKPPVSKRGKAAAAAAGDNTNPTANMTPQQKYEFYSRQQ